jgi:hypothetical protein
MAPRRFGVLSAVVAALSLVTLATYILRWAAILGFFWDVSVYQRAAHGLAQGVDPYGRDVLFPVVYHPLVLRVLAFLNSLVPLQVLLPLFTLGALVWLFIEFARAVKQPGALGVEQAGSFGPRSVERRLATSVCHHVSRRCTRRGARADRSRRTSARRRSSRNSEPYGNWQIIGLAVMAILVLVELLDETQRLAGGAEGVAAGRGGFD